MAIRWQRNKRSPVVAQAGSSPAATFFDVRSLASAWRSWLPQVLLIAGLTFWIYWPALRGDFIWDDDWYITTNPLLSSWAGLWKFWFQPGSWVDYYPIQETVLWTQWQLWGKETLGYHLTNVFLHIVSALLVWRLLGKFGLRLAWLGGLMFAIHPAQVESVAWISEMKNTLSLPFFLLAMGSWIDYEEHKNRRDYQWALGWFIVGMLCKITMAPFPAVILLYAWWKRGRVGWNDVKAIGPFVLISLVLGMTTIVVGNVYRANGLAQPEIFPTGGILYRLDGVGLITSVYFARCFLPVDLLTVYPQWPVDPGAWIEYLPWLVLPGIVYVLWKKRQGWGRHVLLGIGFFLLTLAPFLGFILVSYMSFTWVMDHYLYLPIIGLIGLVVAGLGDLTARLPRLTAFATVIGALVMALMAWESHAFAGLYVNDETLWGHTLQRNPDVWLAHHDLGCNLIEKGRYAEAIGHLNEVVRLNPGFDDGHYNLGLALDKMGRTSEAQAEYQESIRLNPRQTKPYVNLAAIQKRNGHLDEAERLLRLAQNIDPRDGLVATDLGGILFQTKRVPEAIALYGRAVEFNPDSAQLNYNLGNAELQTGQLAEAVQHLRAAVTLDPSLAQAHENLGSALAQTGSLPEAVEQFAAAVAIDPHYTIARDNLGLALAQTGHLEESIEQFRLVLEDNPNDAKAKSSLELLEKARAGVPVK